MSRFGRGEKQRHGSRPESGRDSASGLTPIEVYVPAHGQVTVGGLPVVAGPGESVQDAVLNYLHRLVLATGHAVNATVHDQRIGFSTPLRVVADGSSHFAGEPVPLAGGAVTAAVGTAEGPGRSAAPHQVAEVPAPAAIPEPGAGQAPAGVPAPAPQPAVPVAPVLFVPVPVDPVDPAVPVAPEPVTAPAAPATPHTAPDATTESVAPSLLAEPVLRINEAVRRGRIESAAAMAEQSITSATKTLGEEHPEVLQLRELAAYIAYLAGDAQRSFALSMDLARIRRRQGDVGAYVNVQSAAAAWRAVRDPSRGLAIGRELIDLWGELAADGGPAAAEIQQLEAARARMGRLTERVRVRRTSQ
ncbi:tetratricopeptide repeat protein [Streptomyces sp. NBC_01314]|uniref:tetratricopeptide repeat protein n=1 Tax=Streptomyces sp. NBC_01314 TaxID=2903821 RepID=UPI0030904E68|nr:tetratricopeptide repeat protein [Streptomyces sp. NBC_01314]